MQLSDLNFPEKKKMKEAKNTKNKINKSVKTITTLTIIRFGFYNKAYTFIFVICA